MSRYRCLAVVFVVLCAAFGAAQASAVTVGRFITFDAPGAVYTYPAAINANGDIAGYSSTKPLGAGETPVYGFLRTAGGTFTTFNIPGPEPGTVWVSSINSEDTIVGQYQASPGGGATGALIRFADGSIRTFAAKNSDDLWQLGINDSGEVAGLLLANGKLQCFVRQPSGHITEFGTDGAYQTCQIGGINNAGTTTGTIFGYDGSDPRSFMRLEDGTISELSVPGASWTFGMAINDKGWAAGIYCTGTSPPCDGERGFLRNAQGQFHTFRVRVGNWGVTALSLNNNGYIVGDNPLTGHYHAFLHAPDGTSTTVDAPGAGTGQNQGTTATGINDSRWITGYYFDAKYIAHGFLVRASR